LVLYAALILFLRLFLYSIVFNPDEYVGKSEEYRRVPFPAFAPARRARSSSIIRLTPHHRDRRAFTWAFVCLIPEFAFDKYNLVFSRWAAPDPDLVLCHH